MADVKICAYCGAPYTRPYGRAHRIWALSRYCSQTCSNRANSALRRGRPRGTIHRTDLGPCWPWGTLGKGERYGYTGTAGGSPVTAHRWVYERLVGPIPDGYHLHHLCENKVCVNPAHLQPMTQSDHSKLHAPPGARIGKNA